jgi:Protein of unknown function (DUF3223)
LHASVATLIFFRNQSAFDGDMGKAKPLTVGTEVFAKQGDALRFCKNMLSKYRSDEWVSEPDAQFLTALLKRHPDVDEKIGNGVHHFEVVRADFNTKCFAVVRRDGSRVDFSYIVCINPAIK